MEYKLTVGYATYNRKSNILRRIDELKKIGDVPQVEFIIVDNCSSDGSSGLIENETSDSHIVYYRNSENLGFSGNFVEVLKRAHGQYVIWFSDEDSVSLNGIAEVLDFLKNHEVGFLVSDYNIYMQDGSVREYRKNSTRLVSPDEMWRCSHLPGIVFNRDLSLALLRDYNCFKAWYPSLAKYYPHFFLLIPMLSKVDNFFFGKNIASQVDHSPNQHVRTGGDEYFHLSQRWQQHKEIVSFSNLVMHQSSEDAVNKKLDNLIKKQYERLYKFLRSAIEKEDKESAYFLDKGCKERWMIFKVFAKLTRLLKKRVGHVFK